jgi:hypothetical protein
MNRKIQVPGQLNINIRHHLKKKKKKAKKIGAVAKVVEPLPSKCKVLSSNPGITHTHKGKVKHRVTT